MSNNIVIRVAKQDWVCDKCEHIIPAGKEYLDKVILNQGKCVQHERYHDICPVESYAEQIMIQFARGGESLTCIHDDIKYRVVGFTREGEAEELCVNITNWDRTEATSLSLEYFKKEFKLV